MENVSLGRRKPEVTLLVQILFHSPALFLRYGVPGFPTEHSAEPCFENSCWCEYAVFFWLGAAWVKFRAERPSVSGVSGQLHVQIGCKLRIKRTRRIVTSKHIKANSELKQTNAN